MNKRQIYIKLIPIPGDKTEDLVKSLEERLDCKTTQSRGQACFFHRATMGYESFLGKGILMLKEKGSHHFEVKSFNRGLFIRTLLRNQKEA